MEEKRRKRWIPRLVAASNCRLLLQQERAATRLRGRLPPHHDDGDDNESRADSSFSSTSEKLRENPCLGRRRMGWGATKMLLWRADGWERGGARGNFHRAAAMSPSRMKKMELCARKWAERERGGSDLKRRETETTSIPSASLSRLARSVCVSGGAFQTWGVGFEASDHEPAAAPRRSRTRRDTTLNAVELRSGLCAPVAEGDGNDDLNFVYSKNYGKLV